MRIKKESKSWNIISIVRSERRSRRNWFLLVDQLCIAKCVFLYAPSDALAPRARARNKSRIGVCAHVCAKSTRMQIREIESRRNTLLSPLAGRRPKVRYRAKEVNKFVRKDLDRIGLAPFAENDRGCVGARKRTHTRARTCVSCACGGVGVLQICHFHVLFHRIYIYI